MSIEFKPRIGDGLPPIMESLVEKVLDEESDLPTDHRKQLTPIVQKLIATDSRFTWMMTTHQLIEAMVEKGFLDKEGRKVVLRQMDRLRQKGRGISPHDPGGFEGV